MKQAGSRDSAEFVSLAERVVYLQAMRMGFAVVLLGSAIFAKNLVGRTLTDVILVTAGYLVVAATTEAFRRMGKGRALPLLGGMLLVDGLYLAWALYSTGGTQSPLRFLVYLHLIGVTLLASYRTGLKIALWHSLLFFVVFYAQAADLITPNETAAAITPDSPEFVRASIFNVMAFWLVAIGTALFSAINERELRRRKGDFQDLVAMAADLQDAHEPSEVARTLLDDVMTSFAFKRGAVLAGPSAQAQVLAYKGPGSGEVSASGIDALATEAWEAQTPLLKKKIGEQSPVLDELFPFARNLIVVPMFAEKHPVGLLVLEQPESAGQRVERRVVDMVGQFAAHAALAIRNAHLAEEIRKMADTDALTGLANRRSFEAALERELSRSSRNGEPVTLMMIDVDHFKKFNDTYGHQSGDEVLQKVGAALVEASRDFDTPARYGGEEFAVILPSCSSTESLVVAQRLREGVCGIETVAAVTASAGVATYPTHATDPESLIKAADEALYESKRAGRDRLTRSRRRGRGRGKSAEAAPEESAESSQR